jgi:hypothetical protein
MTRARQIWNVRTSIGVAAAILTLAAGCQLFVDLDALENMHCGPMEKACPHGCVPRNDTATGCNGDPCTPCSPAHAKAACAGGACVIDINGCAPNWKDCNMQYGDGCEIDIAHDPYNCGGCGIKCVKPENGIAGCSNGVCTIGGCNPGYEHCTGPVTNGCETKIWTDQACMYCDLACPDGTHCAQGVCE